MIESVNPRIKLITNTPFRDRSDDGQVVEEAYGFTKEHHESYAAHHRPGGAYDPFESSDVSLHGS